MAENTLDVRLLHAYKSESEWNSSNPILKLGETGYVSDADAPNYGRYKIGDGSTAWNSLPWGDKVIWDAVDGIQVGGRNLIPNSKNASLQFTESTINVVRNDNSCTIMPKTSTTSDAGWGSVYSNLSLEKNQTYTYSVEISDINIESSIGYAPITVAKNPPNSAWSDYGVIRARKIGKYYITFNTGDNINVRICIGITRLSLNDYVVFKNLKLEKGNKPTDWSPAPEDKADVSHTHSASDITSGTLPISALPSHNHAISDVTNLQVALDKKLDKTGGKLTGKLEAFGGIALDSTTTSSHLQYILGIDAFADGGTVHWETASNVSVGFASQVYSTLTNPSSGTTYYIPFHSGASSAYKSLLNNDGIRYWTKEGTTSEVGTGELGLGNSIASGTAGNKRGMIYMYGTSSGYTEIYPGNNSTSNINITLPSAAGTLARTVDNVASATKWQTARTITIGNTGKSVDGTANVSWSIAEIGAVNKAGDTMIGRLTFPNNQGIVQNQDDTSNYTTIVRWYKGGVSQASYDPQIGQHNTGGDGSGSITILPYATETQPWTRNVGLYIAKNLMLLDGETVLHTGNYTSTLDGRYVNASGDTMSGALKVNSTIFSYNYYNSHNAPAFIFDKPGSNLTGIGCNGETDTIFFGAVNSDYSWNTSYKQKWKFNGTIISEGGAINGNVSLLETKNILLRPGNTNYTSGIGYDTSGNECIALWAKNTVTRLRWYAGKDMSTMSAGTMMGITPDFEVSKASGSVIGYLSGQTIIHSGNYSSYALPLSGGTMTGNISYNMHSSTQIPLKVYGGDAYGQGISIGAGGSTIVGSGESAKWLESQIGATSEVLTLSSDSYIRFWMNCDSQNTNNAVTVYLDTARQFYPSTNNSGSLGTSSYKWANAYATTFHGALDGTATKSNYLNLLHGDEINFTGGTPSTIYFNYRNGNTDASSGNTAITQYKFCNRNGSTSGVTLVADAFSGNAASATNATNVTQTAVTASGYTNWRTLIWGASNSGTEGFTPSTVTGALYSANTITCQPSTGTIRATTFKGNLSGNASSATNADKLDGYHESSFLRYSGWWSGGSGQNINDASGMVFAYSDHGLPGSWGIVTTFDYSKDSSYRHQIYGDGWNNEMYFRTRSSDRGGWNAWRHLLDDVNYRGILDGCYVNVTGDTMTGNLTAPSVYTSNWFRSTGSTGWYSETYNGGWYMTDSTYIRNYNSKTVRLDNLCLGVDNNSYRLYVDGTTYVTGQIKSSNSWISIAGTSSFTCPDGTAITQPGGANPMVLYAGAASARDCGIFYLSNDNAYVANSSDNAYTFGVFDTDITQNFSAEGNASLCVRSNGAGTFVRSRLGVNGINDSYNLYINGNQSITAAANKTMTLDTANSNKIGTVIGDLQIQPISVGSGSAITDGNVSSITFGCNNVAYAGIYSPTSGAYGNHLIFATTNSYANGAYGRMIITASGNVGIGTMSPSYKLHVLGDIYANGGWLRTSGAAGWYNETYGGGWYMTDSAWIRSYGSKNIYQNAGVLRTDGTLQVGDNGAYFNCNSSGTTISTTLTLTKSTDLSGTADNGPALIVGGTRTTAHMEIDANEITAKTDGTTPTTLVLNNDGGNVKIGGPLCLKTTSYGTSLPSTGVTGQIFFKVI